MEKDRYETPRWVILLAVKLASLTKQTQEDIIDAIEYDMLYFSEQHVYNTWQDIYLSEKIKFVMKKK